MAKYYLPSLGENFSNNLEELKDMYKYINQKEFLDNLNKYNFMTGDPIKFKSYPPTIKSLLKTIKSDDLYQYQPVNGTNYEKTIIVDYLKEIGINRNVENISFTYSTTHAFNLIFSILAKKGDAIIIPTPSYGLFDLVPERYGVRVITIPLKKENNWKINIEELENAIVNYNENPENKNNHFRVKFYYNMNPHNPTGVVMNIDDSETIKSLGKLAIKYDFFLIDDLIYRDLCFNKTKMPLSLLNFDFCNKYTIGLFGLSKSYNLASIRSGFIVANNYITEKIQDNIFQNLDSLSIININSITSTFNVANSLEYNKYFGQLINKYKTKLMLLTCMINGFSSINNKMDQLYCLRIIKKYLKSADYDFCLKKVKGLSFLDGLEDIESGYFALLKINKCHCSGEKELFKRLYYEANVKVILGKSILIDSFDNNYIIRINYALDDTSLINGIYEIKKFVEKNYE